MKPIPIRTLLPLGFAGSLAAGFFVARQDSATSAQAVSLEPPVPAIVEAENALPLPAWELSETVDPGKSAVLVLQDLERHDDSGFEFYPMSHTE